MKRKLFLLALVLLTQEVFSKEEIPEYEEIEDQPTLPILTPSLAQRKTKKLRLDNQLEVYLISDPEAKQSAAALSVEVGSWHDPKEHPGMAHFLEHMLFMGTEAFPDETEYPRYISDHGGFYNAFTMDDRTVYYFSVDEDAFEGALNRFSHFFTDPLLDPSCIERERHAVDHEHAGKKENDYLRLIRVLEETGNPAHPHALYSCGNFESLSQVTTTELQNWFKEHYSAHRMRLAIVSALPLDTLTELVLTHFSNLIQNDAIFPSLPLELTSEQQRGHLIYLPPIHMSNSLLLIWEMPQEFAESHQRFAPELIGYALGHETEKGLIHLLKQDKLANALETSFLPFGNNHLLFILEIALTEQGVSEKYKTIRRCFEAIARLKEEGIPFYLFEEHQAIERLDYQFQSGSSPDEYAVQCASDMIDQDLATYPQPAYLNASYDADSLARFIDALTPQDCIFCLLADTEVPLDRNEHWMDIDYALCEIPEQEMAEWRQATPHPEISLPPPNPFKPTPLTSIPFGYRNADEDIASLALDQDPLGSAYFIVNKQYLIPELTGMFTFETPLIDHTVKSAVCCDLYLEALEKQLASALFFARKAGLDANFFNLGFLVSGYAEKAPLFMKQIFQTMPRILPTSEQFALYQEELAESVYRVFSPLDEGFELLNSILHNHFATQEEKRLALQALFYEEFVLFAENLFRRIYVQGLFFGNLRPAQTTALWADLKGALPSAPYPFRRNLPPSLFLLPEEPFAIHRNSERQGNAALLLLQGGEHNLEKQIAHRILSIVLKQAFFDTLRTQQQTGYTVRVMGHFDLRQLLQVFAVQSSTYHPSDLIIRFEHFLEDFLSHFETYLPKERFREIQNSLLEEPNEGADSAEQAWRLHQCVFENGYSEEASEEALRELTYEQFFAITEKLLSKEENHRRLAILIEGRGEPTAPLSIEPMYHYITKEELRSKGTYIRLDD